MISLHNISVHFTGEYLFRDITFNINIRDRIGLIGKNGSGKTTLLRIIKGLLDPEKGTVTLPNGYRIGYLPQEMEIDLRHPIKKSAMKAFEEVNALQKVINDTTTALAERNDYESASYLKLIEKLSHANERFNIIGGNTMEGDTEKVLLGLGFEATDFDRPISEFSGGWQMRVELAKILLSKPELLLLDEPSNHLDILSIQWLEEFLKSYEGAVVIVSHDRAFLDNVTIRTIEISNNKIYDYKASYSGFIKLREGVREQQEATYSNQQKQVADIERFIEKFRYKASKARQVQSRVKMLDKMDMALPEEADNSSIHFTFPDAPRSGKVVFEATGLTKRYNADPVLKNLEFGIIAGESIAFVGRNGEGKTTLSKILAGILNYEGHLKPGHNLMIGYFAQDQAESLDPNMTVFQTIDEVAKDEMRTKVRSILGNFLFSGDDIDKKVKVLSGGEKSRLAIAKMLMSPSNVMILDEPTNHLDMPSKDILKNALLRYTGTLIVVSHDRDFLQGLTKKVFEFRKQGIREHLGDIYEFLEKRKLEDIDELNLRKKSIGAKVARHTSGNKINYEKKKTYERESRKLKNRISAIEKEIGKYETRLEDIDKVLSSPEKHEAILSDGKLFDEYESLKLKIDGKMLEWEEKHNEQISLDKSNS